MVDIAQINVIVKLDQSANILVFLEIVKSKR